MGGILEISEYSYDHNGNQLLKADSQVGETGPSPSAPALHISIPEPSDLQATISEYDGFNRLISVENEAGISHYGYRPDNLRSYKNVNGQRLDQVWVGQNLALEIDHASGAIVRLYVRGIGLLYMVELVLIFYYLFNAHGDVVQLTDEDGQVTRSYNYDAFGNEATPNPEDTNPMRYCGEYFDTETGTYYLRARYYNPRTGRFSTEDPIRDGLNWYTYTSRQGVYEATGQCRCCFFQSLKLGRIASAKGAVFPGHSG